MLKFRHSGYLNAPILAPLRRFYLSAVLLVLCIVKPVASQSSGLELRNISIPVSSPQIIYTPFVCNASTVSSNPQSCAGAWQLSDDTDSASTTVSAFGPASQSSNIIPQLFFQFRAFQLFATTLPSSNATVNITISADGITVSSLFNSTLGSIRIVNLPETAVSTLTINFLPSLKPTRFDLASLVINTPADAAISSFLPPQTLPPSIALPTLLPTSTSSSASSPTSTIVSKTSPNRKMIAEAVGLTVGLGLGLTVVALLTFFYLKRQRQRKVVPMQNMHSGWARDSSR